MNQQSTGAADLFAPYTMGPLRLKNRARLLLEVIDAVGEVWGRSRVGVLW